MVRRQIRAGRVAPEWAPETRPHGLVWGRAPAAPLLARSHCELGLPFAAGRPPHGVQTAFHLSGDTRVCRRRPRALRYLHVCRACRTWVSFFIPPYGGTWIVPRGFRRKRAYVGRERSHAEQKLYTGCLAVSDKKKSKSEGLGGRAGPLTEGHVLGAQLPVGSVGRGGI